MYGCTNVEAEMRASRRAGWTIPAVVALLVTACAGEKAPQRETTRVAMATPAGGEVVDGAALFQRCATCHQLTGQGAPGAYPPLAGSEIATGPASIPIRIVLRGLSGPLTVKGAQFNGLMPAYGVGVEMSDEEVAAVLTYVRTSFGNTASAVAPEDVARERAAIASKTGSWTTAELGLK